MQKMGSKDDLDSYGQVAPLETYEHDGLCRDDLNSQLSWLDLSF